VARLRERPRWEKWESRDETSSTRIQYRVAEPGMAMEKAKATETEKQTALVVQPRARDGMIARTNTTRFEEGRQGLWLLLLT
jgi:hypothetical protein